MPPPPQHDQSWGSVIGILIIIAVLIFGAVYFFFKQTPSSAPAPATGAGRA